MQFIDDLAAFSEALGIENAPTVVYMALGPWPSTTVRDDFIRQLTGRDRRYEDAPE